MKSLNRMIMEEMVERLKHFDGNRTATAKSLKISIKTFANWMRKIKEKHPDIYQEVIPPSNNPKPKVVQVKQQDPEDFSCIGIFPTNEERIKYKDDMINRTHL